VANGQTTPAKARIAEALQHHINVFFGGNLKRAAEDLGYKRARFSSYTSQTSFPSAEVFDKIKDKWELDLLSLDGVNGERRASRGGAVEADGQLPLFDRPVRLENDGVQITLQRKGAAIAVGITVSPDVKIA
jgi:hypothetical protein